MGVFQIFCLFVLAALFVTWLVLLFLAFGWRKVWAATWRILAAIGGIAALAILVGGALGQLW